MLFQPNNVFPDSLGGFGNGIVDLSDDNGLTITWNVNGNSPMTAYQIYVYLNNATSTLMYTTGKVTDNCPFYGTDYAGETVQFSHTIEKDILAANGIQNGGEYKLTIQEWWSDTGYVIQSSASAFRGREKPIVQIDSIIGPISTRNYVFTATYSQAQGDSLNWVRWQLALSDAEKNPEEILYDSMNIFSTAKLELPYDGFFSGNRYLVRCMVETENGINGDSGWIGFDVSYDMAELPATCEVRKAGRDSTAVHVVWNGFRFIYANTEGEYSISDGLLYLPDENSRVWWNEVTGLPMRFEAPWSILYRGIIAKGNANLFTITTSAGSVRADYVYADRELTLSINGNEIKTLEHIKRDMIVYIAVTPTDAYIWCKIPYGGLYPAEDLFPSETLFPKGDYTTLISQSETATVTYEQGDITEISMTGVQYCDLLQVVGRNLTEEEVEKFPQDKLVYGSLLGSVFFTDFLNGLNAGSLCVSGTNLEGWAIYRKDERKPVMLHLADVDLEVRDLYDYGCGSTQGPYTYYVYPIGSSRYVTTPIVSNPYSPLLWNWSVVEAEKEGNHYNVLAEYAFGKNLTSGGISNNNSPNVVKNFTRFPTVQLASQNYQSGTLTSYIGKTDADWNYHDSISLRDEIWNLSLTKNDLFLKNRKGDVMKIRISSDITMSTMDESAEQAQQVSISWVQVGTGEDCSILSMEKIEMY